MGRGIGGSVLRVRASSRCFVLVITDGTVDNRYAYYSLGFAPGFDL